MKEKSGRRIIERLDRRLAYKANAINIYEDTVKMPNGIVSHWDFIGHVGGAAVLPVLPDGRIVLVRQYRNAIDDFCLEIPAGRLDAPEEPMIECAARELEEETGYRSKHLERLLTLHTAVAFSNEKIGVYVARELQKTEQHQDDEEDIEVEYRTPEELYRMICSGEITDAKTVAAVMAYRSSENGQDGTDLAERGPI